MNKPRSSRPPDGDYHNFGSSSARLVLIIQPFQVKALQEVLEDKNGDSPQKNWRRGASRFQKHRRSLPKKSATLVVKSKILRKTLRLLGPRWEGYASSKLGRWNSLF